MNWRVRLHQRPEGYQNPFYARIEAERGKDCWCIVGFLQFNTAEWQAFQILLGPGVEILGDDSTVSAAAKETV